MFDTDDEDNEQRYRYQQTIETIISDLRVIYYTVYFLRENKTNISQSFCKDVPAVETAKTAENRVFTLMRWTTPIEAEDDQIKCLQALSKGNKFLKCLNQSSLFRVNFNMLDGITREGLEDIFYIAIRKIVEVYHLDQEDDKGRKIMQSFIKRHKRDVGFILFLIQFIEVYKYKHKEVKLDLPQTLENFGINLSEIVDIRFEPNINVYSPNKIIIQTSNREISINADTRYGLDDQGRTNVSQRKIHRGFFGKIHRDTECDNLQPSQTRQQLEIHYTQSQRFVTQQDNCEPAPQDRQPSH
jgi:hypothetical protein